MSKYYIVFERPDGDTLKRDGYVIKFSHEYPSEEELINAMGDILGGTDKGTIIFMQKLYVEDPFAEFIDMSTVLGSAVENLAPNGLRDAIGLGEVKTDAEQQ